jgi:D-3-phosphoglycerate dehydrogenase / 2-oxoglutarate reductase
VLYVGVAGEDELWLESLRHELAGRHRLRIFDPRVPTSEQLDGVGAVVELSGADVPAKLRTLASAAHVRLWQVLGTGIDHMDLDLYRRLGLPLANTPGLTSATSLAEHALSLMLAVEKNLVANLRRTASGSTKYPVGNDLEGQSLGLVGFGASGSALARRASALGMRVLTIDVVTPPPELLADGGAEYLGGPDQLDTLIGRSDVLSLHLPLTRGTRGILDARRLDLMKETAILINVARGGLVDEAALIERLSDGRIRAAGLDVAAVEPVGPNHPLMHLDNVVISPHVAGSTWATARRRAQVAGDNLDRVERGEPPLYLVRQR